MTPSTAKAKKEKAAKTVELLPLETRKTFTGSNGREANLNEPEGRASEKQVMVLYKRGALAVVKATGKPRFNKGQASHALDATK